jgi:hypothetical protein
LCVTSRLPHFLDSQLTDGVEVVSLTRRPPFTPRNRDEGNRKFGETRIGRGNRITWRNPASVPLYLTHEVTWN